MAVFSNVIDITSEQFLQLVAKQDFNRAQFNLQDR
jgi:hypothetical protein